MDTGRTSFFSVGLDEEEALRRLRERGHLGANTQIQGIEKVYLPYHEFTYLITFPSGRKALSGIIRLDSLTLHPRTAIVEDRDPMLVARRGGTLLPDEHSPEAARAAAHICASKQIPPDVNLKGETYNLTLSYEGHYYIPYWVVYCAGIKQDRFDFFTIDARTGDIDSHARDAIEKGFMILDQRETSRNPWL